MSRKQEILRDITKLPWHQQQRPPKPTQSRQQLRAATLVLLVSLVAHPSPGFTMADGTPGVVRQMPLLGFVPGVAVWVAVHESRHRSFRAHLVLLPLALCH